MNYKEKFEQEVCDKTEVSFSEMLEAAKESRQITLSNAKALIDSPVCVWFDCHCRKLSGTHKWNVYMSEFIGEVQIWKLLLID